MCLHWELQGFLAVPTGIFWCYLCFGMKLLRKRDVPEEKYTNAFLGFGPEDTNFALELTYNKDWDDIKFGVENQVDYYAVSFVKDAQVVHELKDYLRSSNADIHVIVKIESADSIPNLHSIITASDGAMVVGGDLGAELPIEEVPLLQISFESYQGHAYCSPENRRNHFCLYRSYINMKTQKISKLLNMRFTSPVWIKHKELQEVNMFVDLLLLEILPGLIR